jgi:hypothetical protein
MENVGAHGNEQNNNSGERYVDVEVDNCEFKVGELTGRIDNDHRSLRRLAGIDQGTETLGD